MASIKKIPVKTITKLESKNIDEYIKTKYYFEPMSDDVIERMTKDLVMLEHLAPVTEEAEGQLERAKEFLKSNITEWDNPFALVERNYH